MLQKDIFGRIEMWLFNRWGVVAVFTMLLLVGAGGLLWWLNRGDWVYPEQPDSLSTIEFSSAEDVSIGQTFVASQAGLQGVDIKIPPYNSEQFVELKLSDAVDGNSVVIRKAIATIPASMYDQWVHFQFEPISFSRLQYYYFSLTPQTKQNFLVYSAPPETYQDGVMYWNEKPQEGQLTFHLVYNRSAMLLDLIKGIIASIPSGIIVVLAFFVPGWALFVLFQRQSHLSLHWVEGMAMATGLSLAFYPILFLFTDIIGLHLGKFYLWGAIIAGIIVLLWHYRPWKLHWHDVVSSIEVWVKSDIFWADVSAIVLLLLALSGRFLMIRGLNMPLWDDSVHHVVATKRIMELGGLFQSWVPYAPYNTFSFHFGFHVNSAIFGWATGLDAPKAVLWGGQFFNWLAVFTLYPLAYRLKGVWTGAIVILVAGFFTQFPLYYVNWGRYPQLMGQAILPVAVWWTWVTLMEGKSHIRNGAWILSGAILIAGTVLGYYRMAFHYIAFVIATLAIYIQTPKNLLNWRKWLALFVTAITTLVLMFPWFNRIAFRFLGPVVSQSVNRMETVGLLEKINAISSIWFAPQTLIVLLGVLTIIWWGHHAALPTLWLLLLVSLPVLAVTPVPGVGIIQPFTIETSLYMPMALIWGVFGGFLLSKKLTKRWHWSGIFSLVLIILALYKLPDMPSVVDRAFDLSGYPDIRAAEWINQNVPDDAFFLINGIVYTDGVSAIAGDAGSWLPIWTKRGVTIPPQYALLVERPTVKGYSLAVNNLTMQLFDTIPTTLQGKKNICDFPTPITHVYLGQRRGMVDEAINPPPRPMLPAKELLKDSDFQLIYRQDRVMIFKFNRSICADLN